MNQSGLAAALWAVDKRDSTSCKKVQYGRVSKNGLTHRDIRPSISLLFPGPSFYLPKPLRRWRVSRFRDSMMRAKEYSLSAT